MGLMEWLFYLFPGGMTFDAILIIGNVRFEMHGGHILLRMFMATITGVARVIRRMTNFAIRISAFVSMIERKRVFDESRRSPRGGSMASGAIGSKLSTMDLGIGMTAHAILRRATITFVDVTLDTRHRRMFAVEWKDRRVIETF